jgi:hypothetical protein
MRQFLLVYRRSTGKLVELQDLGTDASSALRQRFERENQERQDPDVEVVLFSAPSREALVRTHARYFKTENELREALRSSTG